MNFYCCVLQWYIELNDGGTPHSSKEIQRVKNMLNELKENNCVEFINIPEGE